MRKAALLAAIVFALTACAGPGSAATSPTPHKKGTAATPSAKTGPLMVIASEDTPDTMSVRLVDGKGRVVAIAQFTPPEQPTLANCADLLQPPVRIAGGSVYYADGAGIVRRMAPDGSVSQIATFPLTSKQQLLSYAVSPDQTKLIAIVISTPPLHNPPPQSLGDPVFGPGTWSLDLETAPSGGATTKVLHRDLGTAFPNPTVITGWDAGGPTATLNSQICTQAALPSYWYAGTLVHLGLDGSHLDRIGGSSCNAWDELANGTVLCGSNDSLSFTVRSADGTVLWSSPVSDFAGAHLSPDGNGVAAGTGTVYRRTGSPVSFAEGTSFKGEVLGWADANTLVVFEDGHLGTATVANPLVFSDTGLTLTGQNLQSVPYGVALIGTIAGA